MKVSAMRQRAGGEMACVGGVSWKISLAEGEKNPLTLCRLNDLQYIDARAPVCVHDFPEFPNIYSEISI